MSTCSLKKLLTLTAFPLTGAATKERVCGGSRQAVMQQLLATGAVSKLPEEVQWTVRMLLPRKEEPAAAAAKAAQAIAGPPALQFPGLQLNYLPQQVGAQQIV